MNGFACERCGDLVDAFHFVKWNEDEDEPPAKGGVYVIRIVGRGRSTSEIVATPFLQELTSRWKKYGWVCNQVRLVENIKDCNIIYIGCSRKNIFSRFDNLSWGQHPASWPVAALLYFGWELECGWMEHADPLTKEKELKKDYKKAHGDLPALMKE
jgi:hypothetical protein